MPLSVLRLMKPGIKGRPQRTLIFVPGSGRYKLPQRLRQVLTLAVSHEWLLRGAAAPRLS
jgi:hypothetical protein